MENTTTNNKTNWENFDIVKLYEAIARIVEEEYGVKVTFKITKKEEKKE